MANNIVVPQTWQITFPQDYFVYIIMDILVTNNNGRHC